MNKQRRQALGRIISQLEELKSELESIQEEEQLAFDNLPESLQESERGQKMEDCVTTLNDAAVDLEDLIDRLNEVAEP